MWDIIGKRKYFFTFSGVVLGLGILAMLVWGVRLAIDFTGGTLLEVEFTNLETEIKPSDVVVLLESLGYQGAIVQTVGENGLLLRLPPLQPEDRRPILDALQAQYGPLVEQRFESVGPAVGTEVTQRAILAVAMASVGILLYLALAFRNVPNPFRYGAIAIVALVHDALVVIGTAALMGKFFGWEVDALFLTAVLTVIGFSVHDTIVVFDRVRENRLKYRLAPFEDVVNHSVIQTLDRSINTQLTALFTLTALLLFGGVTIRQFIFWLVVGFVSGTYSSICIAAPLLVAWEKGELKRLIPGRAKGKTATAS
nr:protein translocase subunit SecF [Ardenticatena sp.]